MSRLGFVLIMKSMLSSPLLTRRQGHGIQNGAGSIMNINNILTKVNTPTASVQGKDARRIFKFLLIIRGIGKFFHSKPVIPAKAGIQKGYAERAGCPPGAGMTVKHPDQIIMKPAGSLLPDHQQAAARYRETDDSDGRLFFYNGCNSSDFPFQDHCRPRHPAAFAFAAGAQSGRRRFRRLTARRSGSGVLQKFDICE